MIDYNDRRVWDTPTGTWLRAKTDVHMEDGDGRRVFTAGKRYQVRSMHPIATPAFVVLHNDQDEPHRMQGQHLREWFQPCAAPHQPGATKAAA